MLTLSCLRAASSNEMLGFRLQQLKQGDFMMMGLMPTEGEGKSVSTHTRKTLHAFPAFHEADVVSAAFRIQGGIDEILAFVNPPSSRSVLASSGSTFR